MNKPNYVSRDVVNYFHYVGHKYPELNIAQSTSRLFASLFRQKKAYAIVKSTDTPELEHIDGVSIELYRYNSMLFVQINMHVPKHEKPIVTVLPISARKDNLISPNYPSDEEVMQFEVHLINHFRHNELAKVFQFHLSDQAFQQRLVELYQFQKDSNIEDAQITIDLKAFLNIPFRNREQYLEVRSDCVIDKQEPLEFEPELLASYDSLTQMVS